MDDSCAVCAEVLEWVAYGECGHKDVCSTCVARLRFICDDRRCCICKTVSNIVFVTKALGEYTNAISDFSVFPSEVKEGRVGKYWYHEDTQAFFDDSDHYKMIKAMCRLSCSVCDNNEVQAEDGTRRKQKFRNIEHLKGHLFHKHKLIMCSLCLEGRKIFICEQKLYARAQLSQHIKTGDSEVDGTESERGGFMGHPMCEFCRTPFYGDNELYTHMSTEHYTCHICQRQNPGQFEYYKNYDDLDVHFRRDHFLCEDEACLAKKFIVFQSEPELKKHNALEHGGRMSRSQRSAALQIPISFRYRRSIEQENRRGRGRMFHRDTSGSELSMAIQASRQSSSHAVADHGDIIDVESLIPPLESLAMTDAEPTSRYLQVVSQNARNSTLEESLFPPLSVAPGGGQQDSHPDNLPKNTMAAQLRRLSNRKVDASSSAVAWPAPSRMPARPATTSNAWPVISSASGSASSSGQSKPAQALAKPAINSLAWPAINTASGSASISVQSKHATEDRAVPSKYPSSAQARPSSIHDSSFAVSLSSSRNGGNRGRISHSTSAPNLSQSGSFDSSNSDFPPVSVAHTSKHLASDQAVLKVEDVHGANKSLVEKMRAALRFDEEKYTAFKNISSEFRQGLMNTETYLACVEQFGLSHLLLDLTRLLPDARKQRELIDAYNANMKYNASRENGYSSGISVKDGNKSKKGKGKALDSGNFISKNILADDFVSTVNELQFSHKPSEEDVEVLSKDGYRAPKGKSKVVVDKSRAELSGPNESIKLKSQNDSSSAGGASNRNSGNGNGKGKQQKKTSKFHRIRLGDGSVEAFLDLKNMDPDSDSDSNQKAATDEHNNATEGLPVRGVWRNGGGQKLMAVTSKGPKI
ncbi:zinc finger 598 [Olea europaea subsp. europaea]|uniref:RING-type E3 ubiquitin transferase n=1 Tax=Olea europaea subsp. europaea TaxID=158383 RepID=A0A8S0RIG4_OLEEU|nr:zinc finger 598 [Olea europaea subsp. europaea]